MVGAAPNASAIRAASLWRRPRGPGRGIVTLDPRGFRGYALPMVPPEIARLAVFAGLLLSLSFCADCNRSKVPAEAVLTAGQEDSTPPAPLMVPRGASTTRKTPACPGPAEPTGRVYYVCDCGPGSAASCKPGDDGNSGRRKESAFRTYERARRQFADLSAGETIAFCRGGSFSVDIGSSQRWVNGACRADSPCVVRDYRPAWAGLTEKLPIIRAPGEARVFSLDNGGDALHEEGYLFSSLDNDIDDVTMCDLVINNFEIAVHLGGSNAIGPGSDGKNDRIALRSSRITNNGGDGWLGASSDSSIEHTYFENNGFAKAVFNHNIYLSGHDDDHDMRVVGNELVRSTIVDGKCQATSLVVHGRLAGLRIEDNLIRENLGAVGEGCWGIGVVTGYKDPELFTNAIIRGNTIINVGNVSIALNACQGCLVENNVIVNEQNLTASAISIPGIDRESGDAQDSKIVVRNNSIYIDGGTAISLEKEGGGHAIIDNAIYSRGKRRTTCFSLGLPATSYVAVDYNICDPGENGVWAEGHSSLADWTSETGFDKHSMRGDPGFLSTSAPGYDLSPRSGSPLINRGDPARSAAVDRAGKPRNDGAPDIGAIER